MAATLLSGADYTAATGATISDMALVMASGVVRAYCGWSLSEETGVTVTLDSDGGYAVFLPSLYVTGVSAVVLNGTDPGGNPWPTLVATDWDWRVNGQVSWLKDGCGWPYGGQRVTVTYSGGYAPTDMPDGVKAVVATLAERLAQTSAIQSRLENVGGIQTNTTYSQAVTAGAGLTSVEQSVLDRYRIGVLA